jgi:hypothetical protein
MSNDRIIGESWTGKDVEGSGRNLILGTIQVFSWRDWGKSQNPRSEQSVLLPEFESELAEHEAEVLITRQ